MSRRTRVFALAAGLVVSSFGVMAGQVEAAAPAQSFIRSNTSRRARLRRPTVVLTPSTNQTVVAGTTLTFDGSKSYDPDGGWVRYEWLGIGNHQVASQSAVYSRRFDKPGRYMVKLRVIDDEGQRAARKVMITVVAADTDAPVVVLTPDGDLSYEFGTTVTFDGSKSYDPDGGAVAFEWRLTKPFGTETVLVSRDPKWVHTFDSLGSGQAVSLTVIDNEGERTTVVKPVQVYIYD